MWFPPITWIRDSLAGLHAILHRVIRIWGLLGRHKVFTTVVGALVLLYSIGWVLTYVIPSQTIRSFYQIIGNKQDLTDAWKRMDEKYQKVWTKDSRRFESGYKTTVGYSDMRVRHQGLPWFPLGFLFFNSLTFDVSFVVDDRFSRDDLHDPVQQKSNTKWLSIAHPTDFGRLEDGSLGLDSLTIRRRFKQVIMLRRLDWHSWRIMSIQNNEITLIILEH